MSPRQYPYLLRVFHTLWFNRAELVKMRETARASVTRIISKWKNILEENSAEKEDELMIILQNLREKQSDLKQMNREVIMLLDEEELENDAI